MLVDVWFQSFSWTLSLYIGISETLPDCSK